MKYNVGGDLEGQWMGRGWSAIGNMPSDPQQLGAPVGGMAATKGHQWCQPRPKDMGLRAAHSGCTELGAGAA